MRNARTVTASIFAVIFMLLLFCTTAFTYSFVGMAMEDACVVEDGFGIAVAYVAYLTFGALGFGLTFLFGMLATILETYGRKPLGAAYRARKGYRRGFYLWFGAIFPVVLFLLGIGIFHYAVTLLPPA